ncbi:MAG: hypothetical protein ABI367_11325 [Mucilaginibacter sp.]
MDGVSLILADTLFIAVLILILANHSIERNAIILVPLIVIAFATCIIRHINHYDETGRIY